jgi:uncharacterized membrane protein
MYPSLFNIFASSIFKFDPGTSTLLNFALAALRMRVNMSAIGSLIAMVFSCISGLLLPVYQLDFTTPGSLPPDANSRKQIRQTPNFRKKARGRPQIGHLL